MKTTDRRAALRRRGARAPLMVRRMLSLATLLAIAVLAAAAAPPAHANDVADFDGDGYTTESGDADDNDATVYPGAPELCDGLDNDQDGVIDEGAVSPGTWYADADQDGFGDPTTAVNSCERPLFYVNNDRDADDNDPAVFPGAFEQCDGKDNDQDGGVDEGVANCDSYTFGRFLASVDSPPTVNTGRAGRTYLVKFSVTDVSGALVTDIGAVSAITHKAVSCGAFSGDPTDALETTATGETSLRFEGEAFAYNWTTPAAPGCYELFVTLADGGVQSANFELR